MTLQRLLYGFPRILDALLESYVERKNYCHNHPESWDSKNSNLHHLLKTRSSLTNILTKILCNIALGNFWCNTALENNRIVFKFLQISKFCM